MVRGGGCPADRGLTFNTLTDSISRIQREMSQKERLTSLGRLSTVIAHEVRNPLMIIKAALHELRRPDVDSARLHEAVKDIDEEVSRLNRIVNEVLDFARPIAFERADVDLNDLCRAAATAAQASGPGAEITLALDPAVATVKTDAERLRIALINMLVNARHAVNGTNPNTPVTLKSEAGGDRVTLTIADRGVGIEPAALAHVFRPLLHDQTRRHRARPADRQEHCRRSGRLDCRHQYQRLRHRTAHRASRRMTHRGAILLVDDEEKILKALGRSLRDAGHAVTETTSAAASTAPARGAAVRRGRDRQRHAGTQRPGLDPRVHRHGTGRTSGRRFC